MEGWWSTDPPANMERDTTVLGRLYGWEWIGVLLALYFGLPQVFQLLIALMLIDVLSGIAKAIYMRQLNSKISFRGMTRKAVIWLIIGVAWEFDPFISPVTELAFSVGFRMSYAVAGFYAFHEALSILENAAELGLPIPKILRNALHIAPGSSLDVAEDVGKVISERTSRHQNKSKDGEGKQGEGKQEQDKKELKK